MTHRQLYHLKAVLQAAAVWIAIGVSVSRISDYMHNWSDTLGGAMIGVGVAVFVVSTAFTVCYVVALTFSRSL